MSEVRAMTEDEMNAILRESFPNANATRQQCGGCGVWSDWFPFGGIAASPPGWQEPTGKYAYASSALCPKCAAEPSRHSSRKEDA